MKAKPLFWCAVGWLIALTQASAATLYVDAASTNAVPPFANWTTAATNIQDAVDAAVAGDEIVVTNGVYQTGGREVNGMNRVAVTKPVTVRSVNGPAVTSIVGFGFDPDEEADTRCVYLTNGAVLAGLTLMNGVADKGGGVYCEGQSAVVSNCVLTGNAADSGGGAYQGTLNNCEIMGNVAWGSEGGGGAIRSTLSNCVLSGNSAGYGGGAAWSVLTYCTLTDNSTTGDGGGAYISTLRNCTLTRNSADRWGGAACGCEMNNCALTRNSASYGGGTYDGTLNDCTLTDNSASYGGGARYSWLTNCIVYYNTASVAGDNYNNGTLTFTLNYSCTTPAPTNGVGNITNAPLFVDTNGWSNLRLQSNSPCINAGYNAYVTASTDLDGRPRVAGGTVDIGAYEWQGSIRYVSAASTNPIAPYSSWESAAVTIQDAVDAAVAGDEIVVTNGVYQTGARAVYGMSNRVAVTKAVTVRSVNGPEVTRIVGQGPIGENAIRCVYMTTSAVLSGFTLTNGATQVDEIDGAPEAGSVSNSGAGVWCTTRSPVVTNCVLAGNSAHGPGGGAFGTTLINCMLTRNSAAYGAGCAGSTLNNCVLTNNIAADSGGGAVWSTLNDCTVAGNSAAFGYGGGAAWSALSNCTVVGNSAHDGGGGVWVFEEAVNNCIIYYNDGGNFSGTVLNHSCTTPAPESGVGNIPAEPLFVDTNGWSNLRLQSNSPCINAGNNAYVTVATDLDGLPRIAGGTVDMGAYEWQGTIRYVSAASTNPVAPYSSWESAAVTIQDAVDAAVAGDEIVVTNGIYQTGAREVYGTSNRVAVTKPVTVRSLNGPENTVINGMGMRCVYLTNGVLLMGFTLTNGVTQNFGNIYTNQSGGGVWCEGTSVIVSNCVVTGNTAAAGGGVLGGRLSDCVLTGNFAWDDDGGGGAYSSTLNNCVVKGNLGYYRGGGAVESTLNNCTVTGNEARYENGGGTLLCNLTNCTLTGNSASYGGGALGGTLDNCIVAGNSVGGEGAIGGGVAYGSLNNCIIMGNSGGYAGGGAFNSTLNNCTLTNNTASEGGGAYNSALTNCTLAGNSAEESGGGAQASTLINCTLTSNMASNSPWTSATDGGGAFDCILSNCTLVGNWADWGGGASQSTMNNCMVTGNVARQEGGGALSSTLTHCTLTNNSAWDSGAGASRSTLYKCMVVRNSASEFGGGAYGGFVNNCTLAGNAARGGGGAWGVSLSGCVLTGNFAQDNEVGGGGTYGGTLTNCIVFYNSTAGISDNYTASTLSYSCTMPLPGGPGNITNAPLFVDTNGWSNLRLQSNSPCINAGYNAYVTAATDLDGLPRIAGGTVDMGAYEFQSPASMISYAWLQQFGLPTDGSADAVDTDHDGHNNWQEWLAGTDPTNALSALRLASPVITPTNIILTWTSVANRTYTLEQATNLGGAPAFSVLRSNLAGLPGTTSWTDTNAPVSSNGFYRVNVQP